MRYILIAFLLAVAALLIAPSTAQAMYRDGMNLYEYARSVPVVRRDPTGRWTEVERKGQPRARVCSNSAQDTWQSLAETVKHDEDEYMLWAKDEAGNPATGAPEVGKWYTVPNKVIVDYGYPEGLADAFAMAYPWATMRIIRAFADAFATGATEGGKMVEKNFGLMPGSKDTLAKHMADPDLWAYVYAGHGSKGNLIYAYTPAGGYYGTNPGRYVHHRIAYMMLFACESLYPSQQGVGLWDPATTGERQEGFSRWETNVSKYGLLFGYTVIVRSIDLSVGSELDIRQGGLRPQPDLGPDFIPDAIESFE